MEHFDHLGVHQLAPVIAPLDADPHMRLGWSHPLFGPKEGVGNSLPAVLRGGHGHDVRRGHHALASQAGHSDVNSSLDHGGSPYGSKRVTPASALPSRLPSSPSPSQPDRRGTPSPRPRRTPYRQTVRRV